MKLLHHKYRVTGLLHENIGHDTNVVNIRVKMSDKYCRSIRHYYYRLYKNWLTINGNMVNEFDLIMESNNVIFSFIVDDNNIIKFCHWE